MRIGEGGDELALVVHLVDEAGGLVVVHQHGVREERAAIGLDGGVVAGVERELAAGVQDHLAGRRRRGGALAHELPRVARVDERVHPAVALEGVEPRGHELAVRPSQRVRAGERDEVADVRLVGEAGVAAARLDLPQRAVELEGDGVAGRGHHDVRAARLALHRSLASRCGHGFHSTTLLDWSDQPSSIRYFARVEKSPSSIRYFAQLEQALCSPTSA